MPEFDSITVYLYNSTTPVDITSDVIDGSMSASWGIRGNSPLDRIAETGSLSFSLKNATKKYSPESGTALSYFKKGAVVAVVFAFDGEERKRLRYYIDKIRPSSGTLRDRITEVSAVDWMEYAATYPFLSPAYVSNKRGDEGLNVIVPSIPKQPQATNYSTGINTFPVLFDGVTARTKAYTEFNKIALSELGRVYLRKEKTTGEKLVFEAAYDRHGNRVPTPIRVSDSLSGALLKEDGDILLKEDGGQLLLNQVETAAFSNTMIELEVEHGENTVNRFTTIVQPRRLDTTNAVLFTLDNPMTLESGVVNTFRAQYSDPTGGARVNAISTSMVTPVATTDYLMNDAEDGSGTNITADLTITAAYGTEGVTYTLTNNNGATGYLTFLQARGLGVYSYNPTESARENTDSITEYGYQSMTLHQDYKKDTAAGKAYGDIILAREKDPRPVLKSVSMIANKSDVMMNTFLDLDVGDIIEVAETQTAIDGHYYIQSVNANILPTNKVAYSYEVRESLSSLSGLTGMKLEYSGEAWYEHLTWNSVPQILGLTKRTISMWVWVDVLTIYNTFISLSGALSSLYNFWIFSEITSGKIVFNSIYSSSSASWRTTESITTGGWKHIVVTFDSSTTGNAPVIYIGGVAATVNVVSAAVGTYGSEVGKSLNIGWLPELATNHSLDGKLADIRIYNGIVTASGADAIFDAGIYGADVINATNITDGEAIKDSYMRFQGPFVQTKDVAYFTVGRLGLQDRLIDNFNFSAGMGKTGYNTPIVESV